MTQLTDLRVFNEARNNLKAIAKICDAGIGFGDLSNQIKRAAISVVSNIAEGLGSGYDKQCAKFLRTARASNDEIKAQLLIMSDLNIHQNKSLIENINYVGKMLTKLIHYLSG